MINYRVKSVQTGPRKRYHRISRSRLANSVLSKTAEGGALLRNNLESNSMTRAVIKGRFDFDRSAMSSATKRMRNRKEKVQDVP